MTKGKVTPEPAVLPSSFDLQRDISDLFILVKKKEMIKRITNFALHRLDP